MKRLYLQLLLVVILICNYTITFAQTDTTNTPIDEGFYDLSIDDLMGLEITSVSKDAEKLQDVASSIYVITQEDIRRSGATRLQDLLSMVPGTFFVNHSYNDVSYAMREGADAFIGTSLVLIDNIPLQSPFTSNFDFAQFDIDFDEIDRIEVIKGPGGTIYGASAATGIISIFTKSPEESQGIRASVNVGNEGYVSPAIKYGTMINDNTYLTANVKAMSFNGFGPLSYFDGTNTTVPMNHSTTFTGFNPVTFQPMFDTTYNYGKDTTVSNAWDQDIYKTQKFSGGLNLVSNINEKLKLSSRYLFNTHNYNYITSNKTGLHFVKQKTSRNIGSLRADYQINEENSFFVQVFSNNTSSKGFNYDQVSEIGQNVTMTNLEAQANLKVGFNKINIGFNVRDVNFKIGPYDLDSTGWGWIDPNANKQLWGIFIQDKVSMLENKLEFTAGIKAETWTLIDNKPEISPSARISFKPNDKLNIWGAASRSVTTPGYIHTNVELTLANAIPPFLPYDIVITNSGKTNQTEYLTGEFGVKGSPFKNFSFDVAGFYAKVNGKIDAQQGSSTTISQITGDTITPLWYANLFNNTNYGVEALVKYRISEQILIEGSYSYFKRSFDEGLIIQGESTAASLPEIDNPSTPAHIARLRTYFTFGDWRITTNNTYASAWENGGTFDFQNMDNPPFGSDALQQDPFEEKGKYRLDFKIEKSFNDNKSSIYVWGIDVTNTGLMEKFQTYTTGIPMQTRAMFGMGTTLKF